MTIQQFKESIKIGDLIQCIEYKSNFTQEVPEKMTKPRIVSYKDTTGFYMRNEGETGRGSFCGWPKASELTVQGDMFRIEEKHFIRKEEYLIRTYKRI